MLLSTKGLATRWHQLRLLERGRFEDCERVNHELARDPLTENIGVTVNGKEFQHVPKPGWGTLFNLERPALLTRASSNVR